MKAKYFTACCSLVVYVQSPDARNSSMLAISLILLESRISAPSYGTYYVIIGDTKNLVPFGHKELWQPLPRIGVPVTSTMLWPMATTNCGDLRSQNSVCEFRKIITWYVNNPLWRARCSHISLSYMQELKVYDHKIFGRFHNPKNEHKYNSLP